MEVAWSSETPAAVEEGGADVGTEPEPPAQPVGAATMPDDVQAPTTGPTARIYTVSLDTLNPQDRAVVEEHRARSAEKPLDLKTFDAPLEDFEFDDAPAATGSTVDGDSKDLIPKSSDIDSGPETAEEAPSSEAINQYFQAAYAHNSDPEKAATDAGFANREEADRYLSVATNSSYGPDLASGTSVKIPDGNDMVYYRTSQEQFAALEEAGDLNDSNRPHLLAAIEAENHGTVLNPPYIMNPVTLYKEITDQHIFDMEVGATITTQSGRIYNRTAEGIYFNSNPVENNIWGRLDAGDVFYVKHENEYLTVTSPDQNQTFYHTQQDGSSLVFDSQGKF